MGTLSDKLMSLHTRKPHLTKETESLLMEAENIVKRTNYIKAKIDNTQ